MNIEKLVNKYYTKQGMAHIYVLTMIYCSYDPDKNCYVHPNKRLPSNRTVGVSHDLSELRYAVETDNFDISEGKSNDWAVIEVSNLGLSVPSIMFSPVSIEEWYRLDRSTGVYVRMRKPKWSQGIVGWGLG